MGVLLVKGPTFLKLSDKEQEQIRRAEQGINGKGAEKKLAALAKSKTKSKVGRLLAAGARYQLRAGK